MRSYESEPPEVTLPVEAVDVILDWQEKAEKLNKVERDRNRLAVQLRHEKQKHR